MNKVDPCVRELIQEKSFTLMSCASIISITDVQGKIVYANENFTKISGYSTEELIGTKHSIVNSGHHTKSFWAVMWKEIIRGGIWRGEVKNKTKSGNFYWVDSQIMPVKNADGFIVAFLSVRNDITREKNYEIQLERDKYKLSAIYNNSSESHVLISPDLKVVSFNKSASRFVKMMYDQEIEEGKSIYDYLSNESLSEFNKNYEQAFSGEEVRTEQKLTHSDGRKRWYRVSYAPVYDSEGKLFGVSRNCGNIDKRKKAVENLLKERQRLVSLIESIPDAIFFKDGEGRWLITNEPAKQLFKLHDIDWTGKTELELAELHPEYRTAHEVCIIDDEKAWNEGKLTLFAEFVINDAGDTREYEVRKMPIFNDDGSRKALVIIGADVTERRQAEQTILESKQRFRAMADSAPVLIWMAGTDKLCYFFNKVWHEFTGRTLEQEMGNGWAEGVHPDDLHRCLEIYTHHFDLRKSFKMDYRLRRHDGQYRWILDHGVPRYLPNGEFAGYIGSCTDITESRQGEIELKRTKKNLEQTVRLAKIGGWEVDYVNGTITWSGVTREIAEVPDDYVPNFDTILNFYKEGESRNKMEAAIVKAMQEGVGFEMELQLVSAKGKEYWVKTIAEPKMVNGKCEKIYGYFQDITAQVELNKKNQQMERKFSHLIEKSTDVIVLQDKEAVIRYCSPAIKQTLGYTAEEIVGTSAYFLFHPDDIAQVEQKHIKILQSPGKHFPLAVDRLKHKKGHYVYVEGIVTNMFDDENVRAAVVNFRDVTEKRSAENKLEMKNERLEQIAWLFSHEVRGPVATILGLLNLLNHQNITDPINEEVLAKILIPAHQLDEIITKIVGKTYEIEEPLMNLTSNMSQSKNS